MADMIYNADTNEWSVINDAGEWYAQGTFEEMSEVMCNLNLGDDDDYYEEEEHGWESIEPTMETVYHKNPLDDVWEDDVDDYVFDLPSDCFERKGNDYE